MERNVAVVTGADRGLGLALCAGLLETGWLVFAGRYLPEWPALDDLQAAFPDQLSLIPLDVSSAESVTAAAVRVKAATPRVDLLINDAGINLRSYEQSIREGQNYADIYRMYDVNAVGPLRVVEAFLPLMEQSAIKRLGFVSSEAGSIERSHRKAWFGYCMSKSALNMAVSILFNDLRPEGFTFRLYHPGWIRSYMRGVKATVGDMEPEEAAIPALAFFLSGLEGQPPADPPYDEDRLALRDWQDQEWPW